MRDLAILFLHLIVTIMRVLRPGGVRAVVAESIHTKHQILILNRPRKRAPQLSPWDRVLAGLCAMVMGPKRIARSAIAMKPATVLAFRDALVKRKYRELFTPKTRGKPGPKGPSKPVIEAIVEMKRRNKTCGCPRIADQIHLTFGVLLDKDIVRRVLAKHYKPDPTAGGPSWLTFLGHSKDSLWSMDLFRCESAILKTHWVLVVMDQFTRRIIGFGVNVGAVDAASLCRMYNHATSGRAPPARLSSDNDPLYRAHRWQALMRLLEVVAVKSVPYVPLSHPFVERLIGTIRRECLDRMLFWNDRGLERKLDSFKGYFNGYRAHSGVDSVTPVERAGRAPREVLPIDDYRWGSHCRGLYQTPIAA